VFNAVQLIDLDTRRQLINPVLNHGAFQRFER
jgi:hypothetical protein